VAWLTFSCRNSNALMEGACGEVLDRRNDIDDTVDKGVCIWKEALQNPRNSRNSMEHSDMHDRCCIILLDRRKGLGP